MRKSLWALSVAACLIMGSTALANNDCCWDWSSDPGAHDINPGGGGNPGGPPRAGAPNGWSHCSATPYANCFQRQGRQVRRLNWTCVLGSSDPNGNLPIAGKGYRCNEKGGPGSWWVTRFPTQTTSPPGGFALLEVEGVPPIPTMSEWAMGILFALFVGAGVWMLRRRKTLVAGT